VVHYPKRLCTKSLWKTRLYVQSPTEQPNRLASKSITLASLVKFSHKEAQKAQNQQKRTLAPVPFVAGSF
jgi:hypothetical protein